MFRDCLSSGWWSRLQFQFSAHIQALLIVCTDNYLTRVLDFLLTVLGLQGVCNLEKTDYWVKLEILLYIILSVLYKPIIDFRSATSNNFLLMKNWD